MERYTTFYLHEFHAFRYLVSFKIIRTNYGSSAEKAYLATKYTLIFLHALNIRTYQILHYPTNALNYMNYRIVKNTLKL